MSSKTDIMPCNYYNTEDNLTDVSTPRNCSAALFLLHTNIRSLQKNLENLNHDFLHTLTYLPDIICFSETKFKDFPLVNIDLAGYEPLIHADSKTNAGGEGAFVSVDIMFTELDKNELSEGGCEDLWLKK